ncbi:type IV pilus modification protein PilV [Thiocapsa imhoffii]|uniref:Type IV pilus modification protein PilV n=1 Tax=Thiocapsa imhoffii TaxID=382777 RepID=A0A9X1B854_9GAMM|nr:type IV pilus modification protein PilV [Thiocapsa imhoffii]MBK1644524.1 type IV pilus modification protein PilV [Thiocapsa imhoffii]
MPDSQPSATLGTRLVRSPLTAAGHPSCQRPRRQQAGATLLEALIAMVVISVGLLGIAALQTKALQSTTESQMTSNAAILSADLGERLWAVSCLLANAESESDRITFATRTVEQWLRENRALLGRIRDRLRITLPADEPNHQENVTCTLPTCCPDPVCFLDPVAFASQNRVFVQPGATHPNYLFQVRDGMLFSTDLPPVVVYPDPCP